MSEKIQSGDLVFLTTAYENYIRDKFPKMNVPLVNRLAKVEEIIDWNSDKGKKIKKAREMSGKWKGLPIEESKYILSVYYHDLEGRKGEQGVVDRGVSMFQFHPKTKLPFIERVPDWVFKLINEKCLTFDVELDEK